MVLVIFEDNWADEMDIEGSKIMLKEDWERYLEIAQQCFEDMKNPNKKEKSIEYWTELYDRISFVIGSNEEIEYENFEEFKRCFKVYDLTVEEATILTKFGFYNFGLFPDYIFDEWASWNNIEF